MLPSAYLHFFLYFMISAENQNTPLISPFQTYHWDFIYARNFFPFFPVSLQAEHYGDISCFAALFHESRSVCLSVCLSVFQWNGQFGSLKEVTFKYINCVVFNKRFFTGGQNTLFACPTFPPLLISESWSQYIKFETSSDSDAWLYSNSRSLDTYEFYDRHTPISQNYALIYIRNRSTCVHFAANCASLFKHVLRFI